MKTAVSVTRSLLIALIAIVSFRCSIFRGDAAKVVEIRVVAKSAPADSRIYIVGSGSVLGYWNPANGIPMTRQPDGSWAKTFRMMRGTEVYFKITRGNWNTEALDERDPQIGAIQHLLVRSDTTISLGFSKWMDRDAGITHLRAENLRKGYYPISNAWRYHGGDDSRWASPAFDDSSWDIVNSRLEKGNEPPSGWNGIGWFRLHLAVDSSLWNEAVAFGITQGGASEIYLDGKRICSYGKVGQSAATEGVLYADRAPAVMICSPARRHVLAVRYSNFDRAPLRREYFFPGFEMVLGSWGYAQNAVRSDVVLQTLFATILAVLAFIHFLLFLFNPGLRENLYYSISTLGGMGVWIVNTQWAYSVSERYIGILDSLAQLFAAMAILFGVLLVYSFQGGRLPKRIRFYLLFGTLLAIWGAFDSNAFYRNLQNIFVVAMLLEMVWGTIRATRHEVSGMMILIAGFSALAASVIYSTVGGYGLLPQSFPAVSNSFIYGFVALGIAMSVFLSLRFARTRRDLELRLVEVKGLSEQALAQERRARESEIERRLLIADNERKTKELDDARALQLSMLPKVVPSLPDIDIAVHMETATEVGGDYYDFFVSDEGRLTAVIGDATGHGLKAGNMVTVTKGLFSVLSQDGSLDEILKTSNRAIKRMNFHMLTMCLAIMRIENGHLEYASAGMPPMLLYRHETGEVEQLVLKAMPLGAFNDFPYCKTAAEVSAGDALLLVSDGLTELFNGSQESFGMERLEETFKGSAGKSADEIVAHIIRTGNDWRGSAPLHDDFTILAMKVI